LHAQTIRLESDAGSCAVRFSGIAADTGTEWTGFGIEHCFAGEFTGLDAGCAGRGVAIGAGKLARLPWPAIDLAILKRHERR